MSVSPLHDHHNQIELDPKYSTESPHPKSKEVRNQCDLSISPYKRSAAEVYEGQQEHATNPISADQEQHHFFDLPGRVIIITLRDFLGTHLTISNMDIACCSAGSSRQAFLDAVRNPLFVLLDGGPRVRTHFLHYIQWLNSRLPKLYYLCYQVHLAKFYAMIDDTVLEMLREMWIVDSFKRNMHKDEVAATRVILSKCKNLTKLKFIPREHSEIDSIISIIVQFPSLPIRIVTFRHGAASFLLIVRLVLTYSQTLEEIDAPDTKLDLNTSPVLLRCRGLQRLAFHVDHLTATALASLLSSFPRLNTLLVNGEATSSSEISSPSTGLNNNEVISIVRNLPQLCHLTLIHHARLNHFIFPAIVQVCPALSFLEISDRIMYRVVEKNTRLCELKVDTRNLASNDQYTADQAIIQALTESPLPIIRLEITHWSDPVLHCVGWCTGRFIEELKVTLGGGRANLKTWEQCLAMCSRLNKLDLAFSNDALTDEHFHAIAENAPNLHELSLKYVQSGIAGFCYLIAHKGYQLISLSVQGCKRFKFEELRIIATHCSELQTLTVLQVGAKAAEIVDAMLQAPSNNSQQDLPLRKLRKLYVSSAVRKHIVHEIHNKNLDDRWSKIATVSS
eukprot:gene10713-11891_t